jgi:hypothetical protein
MHCNKFSAIAVLLISCSALLPAQSGSGKFNRYADVSGYINITEIGGGLGISNPVNDFTRYFAGITTVNGYVIDHHFLTGIGTGVYGYDAGIVVPVYLDIRYTFNNRRFTPFVFGDGGVLVELNHPEDFGLFVNPGLGVIRKLSKSMKLSLGAGLYIQEMGERASFINVKLGLYFLSNSGDPCRSKR